MDAEKENNIHLLLQAALKEQCGNNTNNREYLLITFLVISVGLNVLLGYGVHLYNGLWTHCVGML